jgi:hypothetical protein
MKEELLFQGNKCDMVRTLEEKTRHFAYYPNAGRNGAHQSSVWYPAGTVMPKEQALRLGVAFRPAAGEWEEYSEKWCGAEVFGFKFNPL